MSIMINPGAKVIDTDTQAKAAVTDAVFFDVPLKRLAITGCPKPIWAGKRPPKARLSRHF